MRRKPVDDAVRRDDQPPLPGAERGALLPRTRRAGEPASDAAHVTIPARLGGIAAEETILELLRTTPVPS